MTHNGTHDAALRLTASLAKFEKENLVCEMVAALLPEDYDGDTIKELPGMIRSAREKGFGHYNKTIYEYDPGEVGPIPLGYLEGNQYVFSHRGKNILSVMSPLQMMSEPGLCDLAPMDFWVKNWPRYDNKGNPTGNMDAKRIGDMLMRACRRAGPFIASRVRGSGIWKEGNNVIQNLNGELPQSERYTYVRFENLPTLNEDADIDADVVKGWYDLFNWRCAGLSTLLLGWTAIAPICGVLDWRPHIFINGPKHTGKSTLIEALSDLLYPLAIVVDGTSTEAGIRQSIGADSRPAIMDEFESDRNIGRMKSIMKLARSASSAKGPIVRGTVEGKAMQFQLYSTFCFGAINPIPGTNADASRIVELELEKHGDDPAIKAKIDAGRTYFKDKKSAWSHMIIGLIDPILESIKIFERLMPPGDLRHNANMSILIGAAFAALNKRPPEDDEAQKVIDQHDELFKNLALVHEEDDSLDCLQHLLSYVADNDMTVGDMLLSAKVKPALIEIVPEEANNQTKLKMLGISRRKDGFLVANKHPELNRIYSGTIWESGGWKAPLRRLKGADSGGRERFAGYQARGTFIPYTVLDTGEDETA